MINSWTVTQKLTYCHCMINYTVKNGIVPNSKQKHKCKHCGKQSREAPSVNGYEECKEEILEGFGKLMALSAAPAQLIEF